MKWLNYMLCTATLLSLYYIHSGYNDKLNTISYLQNRLSQSCSYAYEHGEKTGELSAHQLQLRTANQLSLRSTMISRSFLIFPPWEKMRSLVWRNLSLMLKLKWPYGACSLENLLPRRVSIWFFHKVFWPTEFTVKINFWRILPLTVVASNNASSSDVFNCKTGKRPFRLSFMSFNIFVQHRHQDPGSSVGPSLTQVFVLHYFTRPDGLY